MAQDIRKKTKKIFESYLILGILEYLEHEGQLITSRIIKDILHEYNVGESSTVSRRFDLIGEWLKDHFNLTDNDIKEILERNDRGYKLLQKFPPIVYEDLVGSFLTLTLFEDQNYKEGTQKIISKPGEKPFAIITKLFLVKRSQQTITIHYGNRDEIKFRPQCFVFERNNWVIEGKVINRNNEEKTKKLKIHLIKTAELQQRPT